jgi:hypothetical protein
MHDVELCGGVNQNQLLADVPQDPEVAELSATDVSYASELIVKHAPQMRDRLCDRGIRLVGFTLCRKFRPESGTHQL